MNTTQGHIFFSSNCFFILSGDIINSNNKTVNFNMNAKRKAFNEKIDIYSLGLSIFGLLSGNNNIIRLPSKNFFQVKILCKILKKLSMGI